MEGGPSERETWSIVYRSSTRGPILEFVQVWWSVKYFGSDGCILWHCRIRTSEKFRITRHFSVDLQGGGHTMFIYCDLVEHEILGDSHAALLRVIPLQQNVASTGATCYWTFDKMQWKRLKKSDFQPITVSHCNESGQLMPLWALVEPISHCPFDDAKKPRQSVTVNFYEQLCGSGAIIIIIITITISKIIVVIMDSYYASHMASGSVGRFHGPARQFGSGAGLGVFALRVGRTAVPLLKKNVGPFLKQVGQSILEEALPEVVNLIKGEKKKQALKLH